MGHRVLFVSSGAGRIATNCIIYDCNGQYIFSASSRAKNLELQQTVDCVKQVVCSDELVPASDSHVFVYKANGSFEYVAEFEFSNEQSVFSSGHLELLAVKFTLERDGEILCGQVPTMIYWQTDSKNLVTFLTRGSKKLVERLEKKLIAIVC